jgi:hypothetical protein
VVVPVSVEAVTAIRGEKASIHRTLHSFTAGHPSSFQVHSDSVQQTFNSRHLEEERFFNVNVG